MSTRAIIRLIDNHGTEIDLWRSYDGGPPCILPLISTLLKSYGGWVEKPTALGMAFHFMESDSMIRPIHYPFWDYSFFYIVEFGNLQKTIEPYNCCTHILTHSDERYPCSGDWGEWQPPHPNMKEWVDDGSISFREPFLKDPIHKEWGFRAKPRRAL